MTRNGLNSPVAQLVEQRPVKAKVRGSSPRRGAKPGPKPGAGPGHVCDWCDDAIKRYQNGETFESIGKDYGVHASAARARVVRHGGTGRSRGTPYGSHVCIPRCDEIKDAYARGDSLEKIGLGYDLSRERIRQIVRAHGVPIRPSGGGDRTTMRHHCDDLCMTILAAAKDDQIMAYRIADEHNWPSTAVLYRARIHGLKPMRVQHVCKDRCQRVMKWLAKHPKDTVFTAGGHLDIGPSWLSNIFRHNHPDLWRVNGYRVVDGLRVRIRKNKKS